MPTHAEKRAVPYTPQQMYDLIADIRSYPEFLPWCSAVRVRSERPVGGGTVVDADLIISFKVFRERFGSRVTLDPAGMQIDVAYLDGPFRYLDNHWEFRELPGGGTEIDFYVDFEFRSRTLQSLIGLVFDQAMRRVVRAFEERAAALYDPVTLSRGP